MWIFTCSSKKFYRPLSPKHSALTNKFVTNKIVTNNFVSNKLVSKTAHLVQGIGGIIGMSFINSVFVDAMVSDNNDDLEKKIDEVNRKLDELSKKL